MRAKSAARPAGRIRDPDRTGRLPGRGSHRSERRTRAVALQCRDEGPGRGGPPADRGARHHRAGSASQGPPRAGPAGPGAGVRQDPERQPRHLLHDLPSPRLCHRRRPEPLGGAGRHWTGAGAGASAGRLHPPEFALAVQHVRHQAAVLGRPGERGRVGCLPHSRGRGAHPRHDPGLRVRRRSRPSRSSRCSPGRRCAPSAATSSPRSATIISSRSGPR